MRNTKRSCHDFRTKETDGGSFDIPSLATRQLHELERLDAGTAASMLLAFSDSVKFVCSNNTTRAPCF